MLTIWQDIRYGVRGVRNQPGFALLAVLTLALGIGGATTIFSVIQNVLLDPFPYTDAHRVAMIQIHDLSSNRPGGRSGFQIREFLDYQEQSHVFNEVIGGGYEDVLWTTGEGTEQFDGGLVTPNTFQFLGVPALLGRGLTPEDAKPGAPPVFVLAYKAWGGASTAIRRSSAAASSSTACRGRSSASCRRASRSWLPICGVRWRSIALTPRRIGITSRFRPN